MFDRRGDVPLDFTTIAVSSLLGSVTNNCVAVVYFSVMALLMPKHIDVFKSKHFEELHNQAGPNIPPSFIGLLTDRIGQESN